MAEEKTNRVIYEPEQLQDFSFSLFRANIFSIFLLLISIIVFIVPFIILYNTALLLEGLNSFLFNLIVSIPVLITGTIIHELIHGLCFIWFGKKCFSEVKFGFDVKTFTPYTHCKSPVKINAYKIGAFAPSLVLGIIPAILGLMSGNSLVMIWGITFIFLSGADLLTLWKIKSTPTDRFVLDHPERAGCFVIEKS